MTTRLPPLLSGESTPVLSSTNERWKLRSDLRAGRIERIRPGAYLPAIEPGSIPSWDLDKRLAWARIAAVHAQLTTDAVFSHTTAALIHGLALERISTDPHIIQPHKQRRSTHLIRHSHSLGGDDVGEIDGLPVTSLARTVSDCLKDLPAREGLAIADSALATAAGGARQSSPSATARVIQLRRSIARLIDTSQLRGRRRARAVLAVADPGAESVRESTVRWLVMSRGLPAPTCQFPVRTTLDTFYADVGWHLRDIPGVPEDTPGALLIEYDGEEKYLRTDRGPHRDDSSQLVQSIMREKRRENAIRELPGVRLVRLDRQDLHSPDRAIARVMGTLPAQARLHLRPRADLLI